MASNNEAIGSFNEHCKQHFAIRIKHDTDEMGALFDGYRRHSIRVFQEQSEINYGESKDILVIPRIKLIK